jgi:hypothetical protein
VYCFADEGDTLWYKRFVTPEDDWFNDVCLTSDGGACMVGSSESRFYAMRIDSVGTLQWADTFGIGYPASGLRISTTIDGGYLLGGHMRWGGLNYDLLLMRLSMAGDLLWQKSYGDYAQDIYGNALELPNGRIAMVGGEKRGNWFGLRPALYMLESNGDTVWSRLYDINSGWATFRGCPILIANGDLVLSGEGDIDGTRRGMLMRVDSTGDQLWTRHYETSEVTNNQIFDARRAVDGGFILAGTATDSIFLSWDDWLVKVDSFGCLVPGCQVFDGLLDQVTDLRDALEVFPNPASGQATVRIDLPEGTKTSNLRLALVCAEGKLVQEDAIASTAPTQVLDLARCAPGLYFVHLLDGARWLSGTKVVVE